MDAIVRALPVPFAALQMFCQAENIYSSYFAFIWRRLCSALQNAEIFTLTYGSMVRQLITDLEDVNDVNKQLETM